MNGLMIAWVDRWRTNGARMKQPPPHHLEHLAIRLLGDEGTDCTKPSRWMHQRIFISYKRKQHLLGGRRFRKCRNMYRDTQTNVTCSSRDGLQSFLSLLIAEKIHLHCLPNRHERQQGLRRRLQGSASPVLVNSFSLG